MLRVFEKMSKIIKGLRKRESDFRDWNPLSADL
jgi:hypothetical protein